MKSTEYLYNIKPEQLYGLEYYEALKFKLDNCTELFRKLYMHPEDNERLFWVNKAMNHTQKLLNERDSEWLNQK